MSKYLIRFCLAPGDVVAASALVRDLKTTYGDGIEVDFHTNHPEVFHNTGFLTPLRVGDPGVQVVDLDYRPYMSESKAGLKRHFITAFHRDFTARTGIPVECLEPRPHLQLSPERQAERPIAGRYWLMLAGGKQDITIKHWDYAWYQDVVDGLRPHGVRIVQTGAARHTHPPLRDVCNVVGWGGLAELFWQIYHAEGVICPVTCAMHVAAAFHKPCVVIAGGREEPWWEAYNNEWDAFGPKAIAIYDEHRFLHTLGQLSCCQESGCWKQKVVRDPREPEADSICVYRNPRAPGLQPLPECMARITPEAVCEAVLSYGHFYPMCPDEPELLVQWDAASNKKETVPVPPKPLWKTKPSHGSAWRGENLGPKLTCVVPAGAPILNDLWRTAPPSKVEFITEPVPTDSYVRQLFYWLTKGRLKTPYVAWFAPDATLLADDWLYAVANVIQRQTLPVGLYGGVLRAFAGPEDANSLLEDLPYFPRARPLVSHVSGNVEFSYVSGPLVVAQTSALRTVAQFCRLDNCLLDQDAWILGELLRQHNFRLKSFNDKQELVGRRPGKVNHGVHSQADIPSSQPGTS